MIQNLYYGNAWIFEISNPDFLIDQLFIDFVQHSPSADDVEFSTWGSHIKVAVPAPPTLKLESHNYPGTAQV
jgi:hypothetical protein